MLTTLLFATALADIPNLPPLPSIELSVGVGYGATGGEIDAVGSEGLLGVAAEPEILQVMGPALDARASLALKRGRWWQLQGVLNGWWVPSPVVRYSGDLETDPDLTPFVAQVHAGLALAVHPGPRIRLNGGVGVVGQKFQTDVFFADYTQLGVGWELNAMWIWDLGPKWAVGAGIGTTGHAVPRTGPDKNLFSGGEAGLRLTFIQDGMKKRWMSPKDKVIKVKEDKVEALEDRREDREKEKKKQDR
jgi:hypothetical protein